MFDKFLQNQPKPPEPEPEKPARRKPGPKPSGKYKSKWTDRHDKFGRVKPEYATRPDIAGKKHWKAKRKARQEGDRRYRSTPYGAQYVKQYNASLRRKYIQNRSVARIFARKHGMDPFWWYQLTYSDWLVLWTTSEEVYHPELGLVPATAAQGPCVKKHTTYADRFDRTKPYTTDNIAVWYHGKPLKNRLKELVTEQTITEQSEHTG